MCSDLEKFHSKVATDKIIDLHGNVMNAFLLINYSLTQIKTETIFAYWQTIGNHNVCDDSNPIGDSF